jgi:hypothetical protein
MIASGAAPARGRRSRFPYQQILIPNPRGNQE